MSVCEFFRYTQVFLISSGPFGYRNERVELSENHVCFPRNVGARAQSFLSLRFVAWFGLLESYTCPVRAAITRFPLDRMHQNASFRVLTHVSECGLSKCVS